MRHSRILLLLVATAFALLPACGGGGNGFGVAIDPLVITSNAIPPTLQSGDYIDWEIPLSGGCSGIGPFVVEIIDGAMPDGVGTEDGARHHLVGNILEDGLFSFTVKVTDTSCVPFATTTMDYSWNVTQGEVRIVGSNPAMTAWGDFDDPAKHGTSLDPIDALPTVVYGTFTSIQMIVAGGVGPYTMVLIDDPADPLDGDLPLGTGIAINSTNILGTPNSVGASGPFLLTLRVTDSVGNSTDQKFQWKIDTPPIILATTSLIPGTQGLQYTDSISVVDGVPPLAFEFLDNVPDDDGNPDTLANQHDNVDYSGAGEPVVDGFDDTNPALAFQLTASGPATAGQLVASGPRASYPLDTDPGPYPTHPPEGVALDRNGANPGTIAGVPRRAGSFTVRIHAYSTLVPNERGQHAFGKLPLTIAAGTPMAVNPSYTLENQVDGTIPSEDGRPTLPPLEQTVVYNPDVANGAAYVGEGLQLLAVDGVPFDGLTDAPHLSDVASDGSESAGRYSWTGDLNKDGVGAWGTLPNAFQFMDAFGLIGTGFGTGATDPGKLNADSLIRTTRRYIELSVEDHALPLSMRTMHTHEYGLEVGPDKIIITESTRSLSQTYNYWSSSQRHEWNDHEQRIKKFQGFTAGALRQDLDDTDMAASHGVPGIAFNNIANETNPLGSLLSGATAGSGNSTNASLDLHRPTVVATGWWDDDYGLNPKGAQHGKRADWNRGYAYLGMYGSSYSNHGNHQPSVANLDLPDVDGSAIPAGANPEVNGIYTDGGTMFVFESANRFGIFVVRNDAKVYVPFALRKNGTTHNYEGFGDGLLFTPGVGVNSGFQTVQMTVSPNGRFAALKLKRDAQNLYEDASLGAIVLVSLTGEKCFGESSLGANDGATYKIIGNGENTTGSGNRIQYASSMALTDTHLYFLIGSRSPSSTSSSSTPMYYQSWSGHYFMQYEVLSTASDATLLTSGDAYWTNSSGTPMQTTYHHHGPNYSSGGLYESSSTYGRWPYHRYFQEQGMNLQEHGWAPTPFRVSANGRAVCFLAGQDPMSTSTASSHIYRNRAWVCMDGGPARAATSIERRGNMGSARGYTLVHGPSEYAMWGRYSGPTSGLEISDDGLAIAFVYNSLSTSSTTYSSSSYSSSSHSWMRNRDNVLLAYTTAADEWATTFTNREVTSSIFGTPHRWRFGCLHFTANTNPSFSGGYSTSTSERALIFWGGAPVYQGSSTYYIYNQSYQIAGTFYSTAFNASNVHGMLTTSEGGLGTSNYTSVDPSSSFGSTTSGDSSSNRRYGVIQPMGGFVSKNRRFLYISSIGAMSTSEKTACKLVGLNVSRSYTSSTSARFNNHTPGEGDIPASWPSRRGFMGNYIYYPWYPLYYGYAPARKQGMGRQVMAKETGWVFFGSNWQRSGPGRYYYYGGPPISTYYYGCYGYGGCGMHGFNADMNGAIADLTVPGTTSNGSTSSTYHGLQRYLEVTRDGTRLAYGISRDYYRDQHNGELVQTAWNIDFDTVNGAMHGGFNRALHTARNETQTGRSGEMVAFSSTDPTVMYYAFKSGASNETGKEMVRAKLNADNTWDYTRYTTLPGRMNVIRARR